MREATFKRRDPEKRRIMSAGVRTVSPPVLSMCVKIWDCINHRIKDMSNGATISSLGRLWAVADLRLSDTKLK